MSQTNVMNAALTKIQSQVLELEMHREITHIEKREDKVLEKEAKNHLTRCSLPRISTLVYNFKSPHAHPNISQANKPWSCKKIRVSSIQAKIWNFPSHEFNYFEGKRFSFKKIWWHPIMHEIFWIFTNFFNFFGFFSMQIKSKTKLNMNARQEMKHECIYLAWIPSPKLKHHIVLNVKIKARKERKKTHIVFIVEEEVEGSGCPTMIEEEDAQVGWRGWT